MGMMLNFTRVLFLEGHKKERSLGVMSQKFLMLFLTGRTVSVVFAMFLDSIILYLWPLTMF